MKKTLEIEIGKNHNLWKITPLSGPEGAFTVDKNARRVLIYNPEVTESYDLFGALLNIILEDIKIELNRALRGEDPEIRIGD